MYFGDNLPPNASTIPWVRVEPGDSGIPVHVHAETYTVWVKSDERTVHCNIQDISSYNIVAPTPQNYTCDWDNGDMTIEFYN